MSLSEIFDRGISAPHPWANLRVNNLAVDGVMTVGSNLSGNLVISFSGPFPATNFTITYQKIGKLVFLNFPAILFTGIGGTNGSSIISPAGSLPINLLPDFSPGTVEYNFCVRVISNTTPGLNPGYIQIFNTGVINILRTLDNSLVFTNTGTRGMFANCICYISAS